MKILITGNAGFIGSHLEKLLTAQGVDVLGYDIARNPAEDVRDLTNVLSHAQGVDGIVHLAAVSRVKWGFEDPQKCVDVNVLGTTNVLEAARQIGRAGGKSPWVTFGSSREVFGEAKELPATELTPRIPVNVYGTTKAVGEDLCKAYAQNYGLRTRVLRFSNVYSAPNDQLDRVTPKFIILASKNEPITINGEGAGVFDFTYIDDTVQGIYSCIQEVGKDSAPAFDDFNLVTGTATTLTELADIIKRTMGSTSPIVNDEARTYDVNSFYGSPEKASRVLGFRPTTDLQTGIVRVIERLTRAKVIP